MSRKAWETSWSLSLGTEWSIKGQKAKEQTLQ